MTRFLKLLVCPMYSLLHLGHLIKYMTFLMEQSIFLRMMKGLLGEFLRVMAGYVRIKGQVPHLGSMHFEIPGSSGWVVNLAFVRSFFRFGGCLLLFIS